MMMMMKLTIFSIVVAFLLCFSASAAEGVHSSIADETTKKVLKLDEQFQWKNHHHNYGTIRKSCLSHKSRSEKGATILEMKHKNSCSSKSSLYKNWSQEQLQRLILDEIRVQSIQSEIKSTLKIRNIEDVSKAAGIPITSGLRLQTLNYIVTVELGGRKLAVIVDTGSDLTWVQCQPCTSCYNQQDPLFNPSISPSYQTVPCNSSTCQSLQFATGNAGVCGTNQQQHPTCNYMVSYGDGSYTRGELGSENLNFGTNYTMVNNFVFGCGRNNKGLFGGASGLMGLGRSEISLVSQTKEMFGGIFSYCLPSTEDRSSSGSFVFGGNLSSSSAFKNSTPVSYTKMINNPQLSTFYFLNLTGISIGGVELQAAALGKGEILIDSGTVITRLAPSIYKALKAEFMRQFSGYPPAPSFSILDTCYNLSTYQEVNIPTIKMQFEDNAELSVDVTGVLYFVKTDASQVCLALASLSYDDDIMIIGNFQQKNRRVVYDTADSKLGFAEETCSFE